MENKTSAEIIKFMSDKEEYFVSILDYFNENYSMIPDFIKFLTFYDNEKIDSLISYTKGGNYYFYMTEKYVPAAIDFFNKNVTKIFSLYSEHHITKEILKYLKKKLKNSSIYYIMKLEENDFKPLLMEKEGYTCIKCEVRHFEELKETQKLYHLEEVYSKNSFYPYNAEMDALKCILKKRIAFAVFKGEGNKRISVSKANINGQTPESYQLGGVYTLKEYRNHGLSKLCLTNLFNYIFSNSDKKRIILYVKMENESAINLYEKFGFKISSESMICYF